MLSIPEDVTGFMEGTMKLKRARFVLVVFSVVLLLFNPAAVAAEDDAGFSTSQTAAIILRTITDRKAPGPGLQIKKVCNTMRGMLTAQMIQTPG